MRELRRACRRRASARRGRSGRRRSSTVGPARRARVDDLRRRRGRCRSRRSSPSSRVRPASRRSSASSRSSAEPLVAVADETRSCRPASTGAAGRRPRRSGRRCLAAVARDEVDALALALHGDRLPVGREQCRRSRWSGAGRSCPSGSAIHDACVRWWCRRRRRRGGAPPGPGRACRRPRAPPLHAARARSEPPAGAPITHPDNPVGIVLAATIEGAEPPVPSFVLDLTRHRQTRPPPARRGAARGRAPGRVRGRAAGCRARLRAGAAAAARGAARAARAARSSCCCPRTPTRVTRPRERAGSSARSASRCCRAAASAGAPGSSRRRTSSASGRARSTCSRRAGSSAPPPPRWPSRCRRPRRGRSRSRSRPATSPGLDALAEHLALAGLRARRPRPGARPVRRPRRARRRLPDDRPRAAPRRALRRRDRGDPRLLAVHAARAARGRGRGRLPGRRAAARPASSRPFRTTAEGLSPGHVPNDLVPPLDRPPDLVWQPDAGARGLGRGPAAEGLSNSLLLGSLDAPPSSTRSRAARRTRSRRSARRSRRAGWPRPRTSSPASCAPATGSSSRSRTAARRCAPPTSCAAIEPRVLEPGEPLPDEPELLFAVSPARRGFVWRDLGLVLLPDTQVFRKRTPRARRTRRPRAPELRRPAHRRLRRPRGPRHRQAARLRDEDRRRGHARLPLPRLPRRRPALRPARADRQGLEVHRRRRERAGAQQARRQGLAEPQEPRAHERARAGRRAARALRAPPAGAQGSRTTSPATGSSGSRPSSRTARPRTSAPRSRPSRRTSRRRARWTGSSAATSASARPRSRSARPSPSRSTASRR